MLPWRLILGTASTLLKPSAARLQPLDLYSHVVKWQTLTLRCTNMHADAAAAAVLVPSNLCKTCCPGGLSQPSSGALQIDPCAETVEARMPLVEPLEHSSLRQQADSQDPAEKQRSKPKSLVSGCRLEGFEGSKP